MSLRLHALPQIVADSSSQATFQVGVAERPGNETLRLHLEAFVR